MPKMNCKGGLTKQCFKDECDINSLMDKYSKFGQLPTMIKKNPIYGDFSKSRELQEAYAIVEKAKLQFELLDVRVRDRFEYDPVKFLEFVENPQNTDELIEMGLANKPEPKVENTEPGTGK